MTTMTIEAGNVELTKQAALRLLEMANRDYEAAEQAGQGAERRITDLDNLAAELAAHGISGPLMEAVVSMSENAVKAQANARERIATADKDKQDANALLAAVAQHENAADALAATQGAAHDTGFYGVRH